jgi:hypothetical protein
MSLNLTITRSANARTLFFITAAITVATLLWILHVRAEGGQTGLTPIFYVLLTYFDYRTAMVMLIVLLVAMFVRPGPWMERGLRWLGTHPVAVSVATALVLCVGSLWVYLNHPLSMDEYAPFLQSQAFAAGHLTGQYPPQLFNWIVPFENQNTFLTISRDTGNIASGYWPGFALLLTPFTWAGIPWACNPVLTGLSVLAIHRLTIRLFADETCAGLAMLFTVASPVVFADGISYYSMTAHMLCNLLFAILLLDATPKRLLLAGLVGSVALTLHNPLPHLLFALPWGLWLLSRPGGIRMAAYLIAGYLPLCLLLGVGWYWFISDYLHRGPIDTAAHLRDQAGRMASMFGLPDATVITARIGGLAKLWLWAVPGLLVLACSGASRHRRMMPVRLLIASAALTFIGFLFVLVDQGHGWGYRYFHSAWFVLPVLAAASLSAPAHSPSEPGPIAQGDMRAFAVACACIWLIAGVSQRAVQIRTFLVEHLRQLPAYTGSEPRIVLLDPSKSFYGYDLLQNDAFLRGNEIRMLSRGAAENAAVVAFLKPDFHRVYADSHGEVWSAAPAPARN